MPRKPRHYLIENIIAEHTVNLLGGPVGAGKTSWLLKTLLAFKKGEEVLGQETHPCDFAYISADRAKDDVDEVMERLGIPEEAFPIFDVLDSAKTVFDLPAVLPPSVKLLVIDSFAMLMGDARVNDYVTVGKFVRDVRKLCKSQDITIIGSVHTAKAKEGDAYSAPKQRFLGSVAWGGFADTLILIEPNKPSNVEDLNRSLFVMPKNRRDTYFNLAVSPEDGSLSVQEHLDIPRVQLWAALPQGAELERKAIQAQAEQMGIKASMIDKTLKKMIEVGELVHGVKYGTYVRPSAMIGIGPKPETKSAGSIVPPKNLN